MYIYMSLTLFGTCRLNNIHNHNDTYNKLFIDTDIFIIEICSNKKYIHNDFYLHHLCVDKRYNKNTPHEIFHFI